MYRYRYTIVMSTTVVVSRTSRCCEVECRVENRPSSNLKRGEQSTRGHVLGNNGNRIVLRGEYLRPISHRKRTSAFE